MFQHVAICLLQFDGLNNLLILNLDFNEITELDKHFFSGLNNLKALFLASNKLTEIKEETFIYLKNLRSLGLILNNFSETAKNLLRDILKDSVDLLYL